MKRPIAAVSICALMAATAIAQTTPADIRSVAMAPSPSTLAPGWQNGAFIEIFVRGWRDSDGDGIGDLRGLIQGLDYLRDLGVKGIWLMPASPSADRDHGYATTDYRAIEPAYGTLADFDELLRKAHARGIGVIMAPGTPYIYYGEEIGMSGGRGLSGDPKLRTPMSWTADKRNAGFTSGTPFRALSANVETNNVAAQAADPNSLLGFYKAMLRLRNTLPSIARGNLDKSFVNGSVMGLHRKLGKEHSIVVVNYGDTEAGVSVDGFASNGWLERVYPTFAAADAKTVASDAAGTARLTLAPQSVHVYLVVR